MSPPWKHVRERFAHDGEFWRRFAKLGAEHGPSWFVQWSPMVFGVSAAALVPEARRSVIRNLHRIRGKGTVAQDVVDVARTFASYAGCLAEGLGAGGKHADVRPRALVFGARNMEMALALRSGVIFVTAHTGGWETAGPVLAREHGLRLLMVMNAERDPRAQALHDDARRRAGLGFVHVGADPFASLELLRHLRTGGAVAMQIDRVPPGVRGRSVPFLNGTGTVPEGPVRLAAASRAPIVPIFCARRGYREYTFELHDAIHVPKKPTDAEVDTAAKAMAAALECFLGRHPTQWFHFGDRGT
ncbi:MAG: lysophospholipid acyltransferase family protein [Polyangiaceae bacterium]